MSSNIGRNLPVINLFNVLRCRQKRNLPVIDLFNVLKCRQKRNLPVIDLFNVLSCREKRKLPRTDLLNVLRSRQKKKNRPYIYIHRPISAAGSCSFTWSRHDSAVCDSLPSPAPPDGSGPWSHGGDLSPRYTRLFAIAACDNLRAVGHALESRVVQATRCSPLAWRSTDRMFRLRQVIQKAVASILRTSQSSGAVRNSRWLSWASRVNEPYGFCGSKATLNRALNRASALGTVCP